MTIPDYPEFHDGNPEDEPVAAVQCADCKRVVDGHQSFTIIPPADRTEGGGRMYWLCLRCWDGIVSSAVLARLR